MTSSPPVLVVRADASSVIGTGHIMRCIALGQAWRKKGGKVVFLTANNFSSLLSRIRQEGFVHVPLRLQAGGPADALKTVAVAERYKAWWVVVDGYHFDSEYRRSLQNQGFRVLWVDDLGSSDYCYSDIIVNQNLHARPGLYPHRKGKTQLCLGPRFALLREEFWCSRKRCISKKKHVRLFIFGGGTDRYNMTKIVLNAFKNFPSPAMEIDVILGGGYRSVHSIYGMVPMAGPHRVHVHHNPTNMAELMSLANMAIVAAGSVSWEIARSGLPALLVVQAGNQTEIARSLHRVGASLNLGHVRKLSGLKIRRKFLLLLKSGAKRRKMVSCARRLVDGRGTSRVVSVMFAMGKA